MWNTVCLSMLISISLKSMLVQTPSSVTQGRVCSTGYKSSLNKKAAPGGSTVVIRCHSGATKYLLIRPRELWTAGREAQWREAQRGVKTTHQDVKQIQFWGINMIRKKTSKVTLILLTKPSQLKNWMELPYGPSKTFKKLVENCH